MAGMEMMFDAMMSAGGAMGVADIEERLPKLAARLDKFDRATTLAKLGGLLTDPVLHANTVRIEALIHLVTLRANGGVQPTAAQLREWLNEILGRDVLGRMEDPPEDVFVGNVVSGIGNSLLFEGIWEANAGYVQAALYALTACDRAGREWAAHCLRQSSALLRLSTAVAERSGLERNEIGSGRRLGRVQFPTSRIEELAGRVRFTPANLATIGIHPFDLMPFVFDPRNAPVLRQETMTWTSLEERPILRDGNDFVVALPTAVGAAIRRRAVRMALDNGDGRLFQDGVTDYQFGSSIASARAGLALNTVDGPHTDDASGCIGMICSFDTGAYAHVLFVPDHVSAIGAEGFRSINDASPAVSRLVAAGVAAIHAFPDFRIGMTMLVFGGLGRGYRAVHGRLPPRWRSVAFGCEDLELFADDANTSALQMFRLLDQEQELLASGSEFVNPNGFLNLYGFAKANDFELLPDDAGRAGTLLAIGTDHLTSVRTGIRRALDRHAVHVVPRNAWAEVRRPSTETFFVDLADEPSYVSVADALAGRPAAAVEVSERTWWITVAETGRMPSGSLSYRVWDMARNWAVLVARSVAEAAPTLPGFVDVKIAFPEGADLNAASAADPAEPARPVVAVEGGRIRVDCPLDYLRAFGRADNIGDRWMVEALIEGALVLTGAAPRDVVEGIASSVVTNRSSRHLHVLTPRSASDYILATAELPRPRLMQSEVRGWADIGLAQRSGVPAGVAGVIANRKEAGDLLRAAVEAIWGEVRERLEILDRASVIETCIDNHNAIDRDRATWRHTAAAVLQLHPREDVMSAAVKRESARAEAGQCSRVIAEMAVCTSPVSGGRTCSLDDFDFLMARVSLLTGVAGRADEIHHGFAEKVEIRPSGALRFEDDFAQGIHGPFMVALSRDQFAAAADAYVSFYKAPKELDDEEYERQRNADFDAAFVAEYGITPLRMTDFVSRLGERAVEAGNGRATLRRSELKADLLALGGVDEAAAAFFLSNWVLLPRAKWDEQKLEGASPKDWFPWRFARRLSLLSRPIVQLTQEDDPLCLVSPVIAEHALHYALRAYDARLPDSYFRTDTMRSWVGAAIDRLGHAFNHRVADRLRKLGLQAEPDYLMTRLRGVAKDGDVDVLAWNVQTGEVFVIECKRLLSDKTVGEVAERLVEFGPHHKERNGRRGPTRRHLDRVAKLRGDLAVLTAATGIPEALIRLRSCLVTSALVPMQFQREASAHFDVVSDFDGLAGHFTLRR